MFVCKLKVWFAALAFSILCAPSMAAWPDDQTIELVVGFAPGGGTDLMARALVPFLEKKLGGKVGVAPRIFLKKLVADILDRIDLHPDFDPQKDYALTISEVELKAVERQAMGAGDVDEIELDL